MIGKTNVFGFLEMLYLYQSHTSSLGNIIPSMFFETKFRTKERIPFLSTQFSRLSSDIV